MLEIAGVVIMHVPGFSQLRDSNVRKLTATFEAEGLPVVVSRDPLKQGILFNYRQCLHHAQRLLNQAPGADWVLIVQDDSTPLKNWQPELTQALQHAPAPIVSLFHTAGAGAEAARVGYAYTVHEHALWGVAVAYRRETIAGIQAVANDVAEMDYERFRKWDDGLAAVYNHLTGGTSCFTSRAIFMHLFDRSTVNNMPGTHRYPRYTIETDADPGWDAPVKVKRAALKPIIHALADELAEWRLTRQEPSRRENGGVLQ